MNLENKLNYFASIVYINYITRFVAVVEFDVFRLQRPKSVIFDNLQ